MTKSFLDKLIKEKYPNLHKHYSTKQYQLSLKIIELKIQSGLSVDELALKLGLSVDEFLTYEDGYDSKTVEEYEHIIKQLKHLQEGDDYYE